jgi:hypothetical protein
MTILTDNWGSSRGNNDVPRKCRGARKRAPPSFVRMILYACAVLDPIAKLTKDPIKTLIQHASIARVQSSP